MKKILLVEDEKILSEIYKNKLSQAGFEIFLSFNAKTALEIAKKEMPDLILLDIILPGENGISFLEALRKNPEISSLLVIVFSNYDSPLFVENAFRLGVRDYLLKTDYSPKEIVKKINEYLK